MRRIVFLLAIAAVLVSACGSSVSTPRPSPFDPAAARPTGTPVASQSSRPDSTAGAPSPASPAPAVPDDTVWLCKPGLASDPCAGKLDTTVIDASGARAVEPAAPAADPPIDCFYVYPTVSRQKGTNASLAIDPEERAVVVAQAARFSQVCRVYAPMYPQLTLAAISKPGAITFAPALVAYNGVGSARHDYMANYNHGRGVVLIGHSQGAFLLTALIKFEVDGTRMRAACSSRRFSWAAT